ncbi:MAG: hypothetical protein IKM74_10090 [Bacteroidales bacterium]|nr:hypothetical protein [Bacteroidales bacterium]
MYASIPFIGEPTDLFKVHESFEFNGHVYHDVLHFRITDQDAITRNTFPTELYYAKHYGPVEYELGGEVRCLRQ